MSGTAIVEGQMQLDNEDVEEDGGDEAEGVLFSTMGGPSQVPVIPVSHTAVSHAADISMNSAAVLLAAAGMHTIPRAS